MGLLDGHVTGSSDGHAPGHTGIRRKCKRAGAGAGVGVAGRVLLVATIQQSTSQCQARYSQS